MKTNVIIKGDALTELKKLPNESVDCIITSPPYYGLRDYGTAKWEGGDEGCDHLVCKLSSDKSTLHDKPEIKKMENGIPYKEICGKCGAKRIDKQIGLEKTLDEYLNKMLLITAELKRVLKKTGTLWWNHGDSYGGSGNGSWNAPIEKRGKQYRKTCNIDQEYLGPPRKDKKLIAKCLNLQNYRLILEMIDEQGWILRNQIIWHKPNCMPSSVKDRFTVDFEPVFFFSKSKKYWFETQYEPFCENSDMEYRKTLRCGRKYGVKRPYQDNQPLSYSNPAKKSEGRNKRCVWKIPTKPFKEAHFAVFPEKLIEPMVKAGCLEGGICLDPFMGAGTTAVVAKKLKRNYLGIELSETYCEIAKKRIKETQEPML